MMKTIKYIFCCMLVGLASAGYAVAQNDAVEQLPDPFQEPQYSDEYLDTVKVRNVFLLNDYSMIGLEYGASYARQIFIPKYGQKSILLPGYYGITFTRYCKMFGYLPYFGFQIGLMSGYEGYQFAPMKETGYVHNLEGTEGLVMRVYEMPLLSQFHYDLEHFKAMLSAGIYGGYRATVERTGPYVDEEIAHSFRDFDNRWDYGLQGGVGFGLVFSPFEFTVNAKLRWSWSTLFKPDYTGDPINYIYAYPFDVIVTGGIHFHLTKRTGRTRGSLKQEAKAIVYGEN